VWLKDENSPGLAISRSIGDEIAKSVGVVCEPGREILIVDITEYIITGKDKFIIVASDGVWEYISNELAVEIVSKCYVKNDYNAAAESLIKIARSQWEKVKF
jgi:serine/threonine protein phosphatase PrpC